MNHQKNRNIAIVDCNPDNNRTWSEFTNKLALMTNKEWELVGKDFKEKGGVVLHSYKRYIHWFWKSFLMFLQRDTINNIIAIQQFYGLCFAFYCRLFHVKKTTNTVVLSFIYNPKNG